MLNEMKYNENNKKLLPEAKLIKRSNYASGSAA